MNMNKNELSKLIMKKNNTLVCAAQKHNNDSDKIRCIKSELDRLVYQYYKSIGNQ